MAVLSEITALLERWDVWRRVVRSPERIDALEQRVAKLEARLAALAAAPQKAPGKSCKRCGEPAVRLSGSKPHPIFGEIGGNTETWTCGECGFSEDILAQ